MIDLKFIATLREMTDQAYIHFLEKVIDDIFEMTVLDGDGDIVDLYELRPHLPTEMDCAKASRKEKLELLEQLHLEASSDK